MVILEVEETKISKKLPLCIVSLVVHKYTKVVHDKALVNEHSTTP